MALLEVIDFKMHYAVKDGLVRAVDGVSFTLDRGKILGIIGESGCGKTSLALSIIRVLPKNARIVGGQITLKSSENDVIDLTKLSEDDMKSVRWKKISMIFQNSMNSLDPLYKVGDSLIEALRAHENISYAEAKRRVAELFKSVVLDPSWMNRYPHEFSGGMNQRAVVAMSLICNPDIVIADEPTTAVDVVVQDRILQKIKELQEKLNLAMILISHNISIVAEMCDRVAIMYGGKIVEHADAVSIFKNPCHPYTKVLLDALLSIRGPLKKLVFLQGGPPDLLNPPLGCRFEPRCPSRKRICAKEAPSMVEVTRGHYCCCHLLSSRSEEK